MKSEAMKPYGLALVAYVGGRIDAEIIIRRDDGVEAPLPARHYFRAVSEFSQIEAAAIEHCRGRILDVGAGAGIHSLALQSRGLPVTSIDICRHAVDVMIERGVRNAVQADIFEFGENAYDTLLLLGHGIGMVEDLDGLRRFLSCARNIIRSDGQVLLDSMDVSRNRDPENLAYHEANRRSGRYMGEIRIQMEFAGTRGPFCGWLHVDPRTLAEQAGKANWSCEIILEQGNGEYLARLAPSRAA
jgi:SAM-dependent methyltransferase